jgi:hypothetical protein
MVFDRQYDFSKCSNCGELTCVTIESRLQKDKTRRRRKECTHCKARFTYYEVSEEFYKLALRNQKLVENIITCLDLNFCTQSSHAVSVDDCDNCVHMRSDRCYFDFPDAGGSFASECSMFERKT